MVVWSNGTFQMITSIWAGRIFFQNVALDDEFPVLPKVACLLSAAVPTSLCHVSSSSCGVTRKCQSRTGHMFAGYLQSWTFHRNHRSSKSFPISNGRWFFSSWIYFALWWDSSCGVYVPNGQKSSNSTCLSPILIDTMKLRKRFSWINAFLMLRDVWICVLSVPSSLIRVFVRNFLYLAHFWSWINNSGTHITQC